MILNRDWTQIRLLYLSNCCITDNSIDALFKCEWPNLTNLCLNYNELTDVGVKKILQKEWK